MFLVRRFPLAVLWPAALLGQAASPPAAPAGVSQIRYTIRFDSATAERRAVEIGMRFDVTGSAPVLLSLPAWTPGAYEISNFARKLSGFTASGAGGPLRWDKTDYDTWRVRPAGPGTVTIGFELRADTLDNAMAWARPDFLLLNGTNVFLYPEGIGLDFPAEVSVSAGPGWRTATGMEQRAPGGPYHAATYHDLVDMPFFIGRFDLDSLEIGGVRHRLASYPAGQFHRAARTELWAQIRGFMPVLDRAFGETPFRSYTTLLIFEPSYGGGSALEHQNSHVGIYHPQFMGTGLLASITAHEIVHAWNVKRLRPADLVPYRYDAPQPTPLLWVSEGITDYYADLALVRGGVIDSLVFLNVTDGKREQVDQAPAVALEDASLTAWIHPADGTDGIYYDKGSLAGLLLDILIRDASDNQRALDDVMRALYRSTYQQGKGFTTAEWWAAVSAAAGGRSFADFAARYVDGRDPFPWAAVGPLAGIRLVADSTRDVRIGVNTIADSATVVVTAITRGSAAEAAGIQPGDRLVRVGEIAVQGDEWAPAMRERYADAEGETITVVVLREGTERRLPLRIRKELTVVTTLDYDPAASPKAARVRNGILTGRTGR